MNLFNLDSDASVVSDKTHSTDSQYNKLLTLTNRQSCCGDILSEYFDPLVSPTPKILKLSLDKIYV